MIGRRGGRWQEILDSTRARLTRATGEFSQADADWITRNSGALGRTARVRAETDSRGLDTPDFATELRPWLPETASGGRRFPAYTPSEGELWMQSRLLTADPARRARSTAGLIPERTANGVYRLRAHGADDDYVIYKPSSEENYRDDIGGFSWLPHEGGALAKRELAGYRIFHLYFPEKPLVAPTALIENGPFGPGSVQQFLPLKKSKPWHRFRPEQQQQTAIGHFVIGNADGNPTNYRPIDSGIKQPKDADDLAVLDLGYSFPEYPDSSRGAVGFSLYSPFTENYFEKSFDADIVERVSSVHPDQVGSALEGLMSNDAIDWTIQRHNDFVAAKTIPYLLNVG